jgi:hypothetical protein
MLRASPIPLYQSFSKNTIPIVAEGIVENFHLEIWPLIDMIVLDCLEEKLPIVGSRLMHCPYDHELTIVEDCLDPSPNNNSNLVNDTPIFCIVYLQLSWCPALQHVNTISKQIDYQ